MPRRSLIRTKNAAELRFVKKLSWPVIAERCGYASARSAAQSVKRWVNCLVVKNRQKSCYLPVDNRLGSVDGCGK